MVRGLLESRHTCYSRPSSPASYLSSMNDDLRENEVNKTYSGGCACGAIRYETSSDPIFANHCQCRECQKRSGTGHASYLTFPRRAEVSVTGTAQSWRVAGDSGNEKIHSFCPTCGTPVYLTFAANPELFSVHPGSLDDPSRFNPQAVTDSIRAHTWDPMDPSVRKFERMAG